MRITGKKGQSNLYYIITRLDSRNLSEPIYVRFYVDTGASTTCISDTDLLKFGIDYGQFPKAKKRVRGIGTGTINLRILKKGEIDFITDRGYHVEKLEKIYILNRPVDEAVFEPRISLLCIDFLRKFIISFSGNNVFLDR